MNDVTFTDIIRRVRVGIIPPFRPKMQSLEVSKENGWIVDMTFECWQEDPALRPSFSTIVKTIHRANGGKCVDAFNYIDQRTRAQL